MPASLSVTVSCTASSATILEKAAHLAKKLSLPLVESSDYSTDYLLIFTEQGLKLIRTIDRQSKGSPSALFVDFVHGSVGYRHAHNLTIKQPLARAVGIRPGVRPDILDATAGLGGDAFVLACLGSKITLCERSPILASLLQDGLERASVSQTPAADVVRERMSLVQGEAFDLISSITPKPHTVYLDPMYPHSRKSALNRIEMRMIRDLVGDDTDSAKVLELALDHATNRVVVKRPKGAELLGQKRPSHTIEMKNSRFDVYMIIKDKVA